MLNLRKSEEPAQNILEGIVTSIYDMSRIPTLPGEHIEFSVANAKTREKFQVPEEHREDYETFTKLEEFLSGVSVRIEYDSSQEYTLTITGDNFPRKRKRSTPKKEPKKRKPKKELSKKEKKAPEYKLQPISTKPKLYNNTESRRVTPENLEYDVTNHKPYKSPKAESTQKYAIGKSEILVGPYFREQFKELRTNDKIPIHIRTVDSLISLFYRPDIRKLNHSQREYAVGIGPRKIVITTYTEEGKEYAHDLIIRAREC